MNGEMQIKPSFTVSFVTIVTFPSLANTQKRNYENV